MMRILVVLLFALPAAAATGDLREDEIVMKQHDAYLGFSRLPQLRRSAAR